MTTPRYRALLIGNARFPADPHGLPTLNGPIADIAALDQALTDSEVGLFVAPGGIQKLADYGVQDLRTRLDEFFTSGARDDVLLLYYSGHGQLDLRNRLYLCAHDTRTSNLLSTALKADDINDMISSCAAMNTIIVLDCCYSGAFKGADLLRGIRTPQRTNLLNRLTEVIIGSGGAGPSPGSASSGWSTGRGRYVLASSRSTQLTRDTTETGQLSPFTQQLVRGLREAPADGHLTVTELYRQVHRWITESSGPTPQLRFSGEGDLIIARRGPAASLPPLAPSMPPPPQRPGREQDSVWTAHRIRTSGVDFLLRATNGPTSHTIEYLSLSQQRAIVIVDRRRIYHGPTLFDCEFTLGRGGPHARFTVTESDLQLRIHGQVAYQLRQGVPGSPDDREELSAAIRATLLTGEAKYNGVRWGVVPYIRLRDFRAIRTTTGRASQAPSSGPIIAVATATFPNGEERVWFTDRATHIRTKSTMLTVPHEQLAEATVTSGGGSDSGILQIDDNTIKVGHVLTAESTAKLIKKVKTAVVYQRTGRGKPPPVYRFSGTRDDVDYDAFGVRAWRVALLLAAFAAAQDTLFLPDDWTDLRQGLLAGGLVIGLPLVILFALFVCLSMLLGRFVRPWFRKHLAREMTVAAVYTAVSSAWITWGPPFIIRTPSFTQHASDPTTQAVTRDLFSGWVIRIGGSPAIAIGGVDYRTLPQEMPRLWGALLLAVTAYLIMFVVPAALNRQRRQPT